MDDDDSGHSVHALRPLQPLTGIDRPFPPGPRETASAHLQAPGLESRDLVMVDLDSPMDSRALIAAVGRHVPALRGSVGAQPEGWICVGADNVPALGRLHQGLAERNPEAGRAFWAVRSWSWLIWQPTMLCVASVHAASAAPPVLGICQKVGEGGVSGYRLPASAVETGEVARLIGKVGTELRLLSEALIADLNHVTRMKELLGRRLLADRLIRTLINLLGDRADPAENAAVREYAAAWLSATGLEGMSGLEAVVLSRGRERLVPDRRACCLEYLQEGGELCPSCPKYPKGERLERLKRHWEAQG